MDEARDRALSKVFGWKFLPIQTNKEGILNERRKISGAVSPWLEGRGWYAGASGLYVQRVGGRCSRRS
jgi:hypothetical protein